MEEECQIPNGILETFIIETMRKSSSYFYHENRSDNSLKKKPKLKIIKFQKEQKNRSQLFLIWKGFKGYHYE